MKTLYTSAGDYIIRRDDSDYKHPVVVVSGREYSLSVQEMVLWTKGA
jgi:hypothetical protein